MAGPQPGRAAVAGHLDLALADEAGVAAHGGDAQVLGPADLAGVVAAADPGVAPGEQALRFDLGGGHSLQVGGGVGHGDRAQQRLARDARPVGALAAVELALDERGGQVGALDGVLRDVFADGSGADDDDVVLVGLAHAGSSGGGVAGRRAVRPSRCRAGP